MDAVVWTLALVVYGSLVVAVLGMQIRVLRDAAKSSRPIDAGARRRITASAFVFAVFVSLEVVAWFVGEALGGRYLGGALVAAGLVAGMVMGFVSAVVLDQRAGRLG